MNIEAIRERIIAYAAAMPPDWTASQGVQGAIRGALNRSIDPDNQHRKLRDAWRRVLLAYLFGGTGDTHPTALSSKTLTSEQWYILYTWIGWRQDEVSGGWEYDPDFLTEAPLLTRHALALSEKREGQMMMELGYD